MLFVLTLLDTRRRKKKQKKNGRTYVPIIVAIGISPPYSFGRYLESMNFCRSFCPLKNCNGKQTTGIRRVAATGVIIYKINANLYSALELGVKKWNSSGEKFVREIRDVYEIRRFVSHRRGTLENKKNGSISSPTNFFSTAVNRVPSLCRFLIARWKKKKKKNHKMFWFV